MTRKSKIARLPRSIRDELNHRLDNGQPGIRLVEWLNNLPEVKEILVREFDGNRITPQNLSEWKRGGYQDWLAQQEHAAILQDFLADAKQSGQAASPKKLTKAIFNFTMVRYAAAMHRCAHSPEHRDNLKLWSRMLNDVIRLDNCDLARQRLELDMQKLTFNAEKLEARTELARLRLELDRQKAGITTVGQASRLSPSSSPALAEDDPIKANRAQLPSAVTRNTEHATPNTDQPSSSPSSETSIYTAKNPLQINVLQPNPTKSNHPFFIFPHTTTVGQASRLSLYYLVLDSGSILPKPSRDVPPLRDKLPDGPNSGTLAPTIN